MSDEKGYDNAPVTQAMGAGQNTEFQDYNDGGGKSFTIRARELRRALTDAEHRVHEIMEEIHEQEHKRDNAARLCGALQEKLDWLNHERDARMTHVRALEALLP